MEVPSDQAPIQLDALSPLASHDLLHSLTLGFGYRNLNFPSAGLMIWVAIPQFSDAAIPNQLSFDHR
jgi:hypothetical protein